VETCRGLGGLASCPTWPSPPPTMCTCASSAA